jgi:hypothetical protein
MESRFQHCDRRKKLGRESEQICHLKQRAVVRKQRVAKSDLKCRDLLLQKGFDAPFSAIHRFCHRKSDKFC